MARCGSKWEAFNFFSKYIFKDPAIYKSILFLRVILLGWMGWDGNDYAPACLCFVHLPNQNSCPTFHPQLQKRPSSSLQFSRYCPFVAVITFPVSDVQKQQPFSSQPPSAKLRRAKKKMNRAGIFILRGFFSACCGNVDLNRTVSF